MITKILQLISNKRSLIYKFFGFLVLAVFIILLSEVLTKISFTEKINVSNPQFIAEEVPLLNFPQRQLGFFVLVGIFALTAVLIGRWQGFASVLGLGLSAFTIYKLIVPLILLNWDPVVVTLLGGLLVITGTIFFAHGINKKTLVAAAGSTIALLVTLALGAIFRSVIQLTGYSSEDIRYLLTDSQLSFDVGGILLASLVLSGIGLLDDITVTQASLIHELNEANPDMSKKELFKRAMNVGKDHAGTLINSLFWAYAASALPLLLFAGFSNISSENFLNNNTFMEEILRTFVTSTGLLLAIPLTSFLGVYFYKKRI